MLLIQLKTKTKQTLQPVHILRSLAQISLPENSVTA